MNERQWYSSHIKPRWHLPHKGLVCWKVEDAYNGGLPDVDVCFHGIVAKIELKYDLTWPKRADTPLWFSEVDKELKRKGIVSAKQWNHLEQWKNAGGNAFVLIGIGREWVLLEQGHYENVPMTREVLLASAVLTYIASNKASYDVLDQIPPFIERYYGRSEERDIVCIP